MLGTFSETSLGVKRNHSTVPSLINNLARAYKCMYLVSQELLLPPKKSLYQEEFAANHSVGSLRFREGNFISNMFKSSHECYSKRTDSFITALIPSLNCSWKSYTSAAYFYEVVCVRTLGSPLTDQPTVRFSE